MSPRRETPAASLWQKLAWFGGLWLASVLALGVVGLLIRLALRS